MLIDPYQTAKTLSVEGHNIVVTGQAGSGKLSSSELFNELKSSGKVVQLTVSTSPAASLLPGAIFSLTYEINFCKLHR